MQDKRLFLLDAMALIYRAHFVFITNPRITSTGLNTSAAYGFTLTLLELLEKEKPSHIGVAFESRTPTLREQKYAEYKAHREPPPEDLIKAIPYVQKLLHGFGIPVLQADGYEADDVMGTLAVKAAAKNYTVYLMTPDKDFAQLVNDKILLYRPGLAGKPHEVLGVEGVMEKYGVHPDRVTDLLGLKGDASDNIPGIPRIGDKTAVQLLQQFGSLEEIISRANEISKPALRTSILENAEMGRFSKELATIHIDVPVDFDEAALSLTPPDKPVLEELFRELEFRTVAKRVFGDGAAPATDKPAAAKKAKGDKDQAQLDFGDAEPAPAENDGSPYKTAADTPHTYTIADTPAIRKNMVATIKAAGQFCFDTETTSLESLTAEIVGLSVSIKPHEAWYVPFPPEFEAAKIILHEVAPVFTDAGIRKIGQNMKYDLAILRTYGVEVQGELFDTMLAHYCIRGDGKHGMDAMSRAYLHYDPISIETLIGKKGKNQLSMRQVPVEKLAEYAAEDADVTLQLQQKLNPLLDKEQTRKLFETVEMPLMPVLLDMEWEGVRIDVGFLKAYSTELEKELHTLEHQIYQLAGEKFNINSPKQLGDVLFNKLKLGGKPKLTATGQFATDEDTLTYLAAEHEVPVKVLEFRGLTKLKGTYVDALPQLVNANTGRVHTSFNQSVAVTGRLSSNNPNLQNIPIRTDRGREVRKAFIPRDDKHILLSADYSQIELRLMAHLSGDEAMRAAFAHNEDIHTNTAARVFGVAPKDVDFDMRRKAKMVNFGIIYGITPFGLAQRLGIDRTEAKRIIDTYFEQYPDVNRFMKACVENARARGYAQTLMGRRHYLPNLTSGNATVRGFAERNSINTPLQGTAAELIKLAMIQLHKQMREQKFKAHMILQVHDELLFDVPQNEVDKLRPVVQECMQNALKLTVPLEVSTGIGNNWLDAH